MENKYQIIALMGKSGAGKDTIQKLNIEEHSLLFHGVVSCTTRPRREHEVDGVDYHFISIEEFTRKVLKGEMLEATEFNGWFYGTPISSLATDKINIGVFNPTGVEALLEDSRLDVHPILVEADSKERLLRTLNREEHPDCTEICRRFLTDEKDFAFLDFDYTIINNHAYANLDLFAEEHSLLPNLIEASWEALNNGTAFETVMRWDNSLHAKPVDDKVAVNEE